MSGDHHRQSADPTIDRPTALQRAQQDLRTLSGPSLTTSGLLLHLTTQYKTHAQRTYDLTQALKTAPPETKAAIEAERQQTNAIATRTKDSLDRLNTYSQDPHPFAHPIYWAAFICQGIA